MMEFLFVPVWAALQLCFAYLFLSAFLVAQRRGEEAGWLLAAIWLMDTLVGFCSLDGMYGYLMYLLSVVLLLLTVYGEYGPKGLCLLVFAVVVPVVLDLAVLYLAEPLAGIGYYLAVTLGRGLAVGLALLLRRFAHRKEDGTQHDALLRQHMEMQRESMRALEQNYRLQRKSTHEFEHHMQVLRDLLEQDQVEASRDYLARLRKNRSIHVMSVNSKHPVIDVILNQKYQTAQENEIKMQIRVNDLSGVDMPADSLVVVLTNLLDNAIEACRRVDGYREIFCSILADEDGLYLSVRNTSMPVDIHDGRIATSKADSLSHGFGLISVGYVLDELGAEYTFGYDEGWFHFAAEIT